MTAHAERRTAPRARTPAGLRLRLPGLVDPADVRDLSSTGVCCSTDRPLPLLSQVQVTFHLPVAGGRLEGIREVTCTGAVVRCVRSGSRFEAAIYFTCIDDADRTVLDDFVSSLRRAGQVA